MIKSVIRLFFIFAAVLLARANAQAADNVILVYDGFYRNIEGSAPFPSATTNYVYNVSVTPYRESDYGAPGFALALPLQVISLTRPAGVSEASALSFVTLSTYSLPLPLSGAPQSFSISIHVPAGFSAGDYSYQIKTLNLSLPTGFSLVDEGTFINMQIRPAAGSNTPPTIQITNPANQSNFTYTPANGPLLIPFNFSAGAGNSTILTVDADLNNTSVNVTSSGIGTNAATGSGTLSITSGGLFTLRARASNGTQTSSDSVEFNVTVAAAPVTLTPVQPLNNAVYSLTLGQTVTVPLSATAQSTYGAVTALSATLNGTPVAGFTTTGLNSLEAAGTGSVGINAPGNYTVVYTATNSSGTVSRTVNFTVNGITPPPVVTIGQPVVNTVVNRFTGDAPSLVPFTFQATSPYGAIQTVSVTLNSQATAANTTGLQTQNASGTGSFSVSTPGTYTMVVTASNGGAVASASRTFTVVETAPPASYTLTWLPPISTGVAVEGGTTVPVKFTLTNANTGASVSDQNVIIAIYEIFPNGTSSSPVLFPYGTSGPGAPDYAITSGVYQLDYATTNGAHVYKVEVYSASSASAVLLGTKQLTTFAAPEPEGCCGDEIMVRNMPTINGTVNGSIRVLTSGSVALNGGAVITGNLYVVGTPTVRTNGQPNFGGTVEGSGASSPTNYQITLNGNSTLGKLVRKTDPLVMPVVAAPSNPTGTQSLTINSSSQAITNWATVKNLTLNGNVGSRTVPPGSYGSFISNGNNSGFTLGVAGSTVPTVYEFQSLTLNGQTKIELLGPVVITVKNGFSSNGTIGKAGNTGWMTLNVHSGGFTLNSGNGFYGCVVAPNGTVIINGNTQFVGGIVADRLTVNGGASLIQVAP